MTQLNFRPKEEKERVGIYLPVSKRVWVDEQAEACGISVSDAFDQMITYHMSLTNVEKGIIKGEKKDAKT